MIPYVRHLIKKRPILHKIAIWTRGKVFSKWYQIVGLGYTKKKIKAGPGKGLMFYAGRRVEYSKDFWSGEFEQIACQFMKSVIKQDAVCYDIGANLGYHSLIMARQASHGLVVAFEPLPDIARIYKRNMAVNQFSNVKLVIKAVTSSSGSISLGRDISIDQAAMRWAEDCDFMHQTFVCKSISVDDFVNDGNPAPTFIKIDVEGAETEVLSGAVDTLLNNKPLVMCEIHGTNAAKVYRILNESGYELFNVGDELTLIDSVSSMPTNVDEGHVFARPK